MAWTKRQAEIFAERARAGSWAVWQAVPSARPAIIAEVFAHVVTSQDADTQRTADLAKLWRDMIEAAGLVE